ncbi:MAG: hypothetical protein RIS76_1110 [Verrucomicrobiota bacterium]|jgi:RNA polymerase sigma factor (sigma-70 family)
MVLDAGDNELVGSYAREGSEMAFRTLVSRHVNLVFGAALRQTGDAGLAEEITQNVFIALARKAPRLAGHETLAGWLHRTALLEAKARLRAELRRQRREDTAAALAQLHQDGRAPVEDLAPILDEGLMQLRESDRLALILRYLEERSLRDVGRVLGIEEDTARKRVDRALDRLSAFFRSQGFAVPAGTGVAVLTQASTASAAPTGLAAAAGTAGLAAGGTAGVGVFSAFLVSIMNLSNLQTAGVCALLLGAPLAWQWNQHRELRIREGQVLASLTEATRETDTAQTLSRRLGFDLVQARADTLNTRNALAAATAGSLGGVPDAYHWDDRSPLARIPKAALRQIFIPAVSNRRGTLTPQIQAALQMTESESGAVQGAMNRFLDGVHSAQARALRPVTPTESELDGRSEEDVRVFEINGVRDSVAALRREMLSELEATLGAERNDLLKRSLASWIPMMDDERQNGMNSSWAFLDSDHRLKFVNESGEAEGRLWLRWGARTENGSTFGAAIPMDEIPEFLRPQLQDWVDGAIAAQAGAAPSTPIPQVQKPTKPANIATQAGSAPSAPAQP